MTINSFEVAFYTVLFIIPGFSMNFAYSFFMPQRDQVYQPAILRFLFFSCINFAAWWPLLYSLIKDQYWITNPFSGSVIIILVLLVVPFVLGSIIGFIVRKEWPYRALRFLKLETLHPRPTGWDYIMDQSASWIIVTLKNETSIYGWYSTRSLASSVPNEKDLYIEELYTCKDGVWEPVVDSNGVWIAGDQIMYIEFLKPNQIVKKEDGIND